jgi:hypothetical protein
MALEDVSQLLKSVNQLFYESTDESRYATLFFADYQDSTRLLRYANCGHNPPILLRADGRAERLAATSTVLGLFEEWECYICELQILPGDLLVIVATVFGELSIGAPRKRIAAVSEAAFHFIVLHAPPPAPVLSLKRPHPTKPLCQSRAPICHLNVSLQVR